MPVLTEPPPTMTKEPARSEPCPVRPPPPPEPRPQPKLADELKKMDWEPLLPVEKKLIGWSIGLGVVLLGILVWVSYTFFPAGH
ncbi:MAG: hypothetical protein ACM3JH_11020 [Acidithiobacillales bacterium]